MLLKPLAVDVVLQKIGQGRGGKQLLAAVYQVLGTCQGVDQYLLVAYRGFVQIDLPVHQSARCEVVLYGVDAFRLNY